MSVTPISGNIWSLELPLPLEMLSDGVHSCLISLETGEKIGDFTVIAGEVLAGDLRAEIARFAGGIGSAQNCCAARVGAKLGARRHQDHFDSPDDLAALWRGVAGQG